MSQDGIVILKKTEPPMCGGTDATLDTTAPKKIVSEDMTIFNVTSVLNNGVIPSGASESEFEELGFISAFAAKSGDGVFLYFQKNASPHRNAEMYSYWAYIKEDIFPSLVKLVNEEDLAKNNGYHSQTHGLPDNFGGSADIRYESGERISFSDNSTPVITFKTGTEILRLFSSVLNGVKVKLPEISTLKEIYFEELRENGGFTKATLTIQPDGTGINEKQSKFDDEKVYESKKSVDAKTIAEIKEIIENSGILAIEGLPENVFSYSGNKQLVFSFENGTEIAVTNNKILPDQLSDSFFNIELQLTTKN